ncbi:MAG: Do family serine endopeptidase [Bdellovibrionales bacterium]
MIGKPVWTFIACGLASVSVYIATQSLSSSLSLSPLSPVALAQDQTSVAPKIKEDDPLPANLFVKLAKSINPAVVNIFTTYLPRQRRLGPGFPQGRDPFFELFEQFMGPQGFGRPMPQESLGTGFVIREDGLIVTNNHVIDRADIIKVQLDEKTKESFDAKVIGKDARTDIALIKIEAKRKLPFVKLGNSADVEVGEWVAAFGNPYGYGHTMTKGIISAVNREINELNLFPFMQTDASINPGNSGGPLVNTQGLVIGVNTAIDARAQGIGFVIPIDNVKSILPELEKKGSIERGFIGVAMADLNDERAQALGLKQSDGALITHVRPGSPASKAGLKPFDLVVEFAGKKIKSTEDLSRAVIITPVGKKVELKAIRDGKPKTMSITIGRSSDFEATEATPKEKSDRGEDSSIALQKFGFAVANFSMALREEFNIPPLRKPHPVVTGVVPGSEASRSGLAPGDVILDINRNEVSTAKDVVKRLREGKVNILRVSKQGRVVLISLRGG